MGGGGKISVQALRWEQNFSAQTFHFSARLSLGGGYSFARHCQGADFECAQFLDLHWPTPTRKIMTAPYVIY